MPQSYWHQNICNFPADSSQLIIPTQPKIMIIYTSISPSYPIIANGKRQGVKPSGGGWWGFQASYWFVAADESCWGPWQDHGLAWFTCREPFVLRHSTIIQISKLLIGLLRTHIPSSRPYVERVIHAYKADTVISKNFVWSWEMLAKNEEFPVLGSAMQNGKFVFFGTVVF